MAASQQEVSSCSSGNREMVGEAYRFKDGWIEVRLDHRQAVMSVRVCVRVSVCRDVVQFLVQRGGYSGSLLQKDQKCLEKEFVLPSFVVCLSYLSPSGFLLHKARLGAASPHSASQW